MGGWSRRGIHIESSSGLHRCSAVMKPALHRRHIFASCGNRGAALLRPSTLGENLEAEAGSGGEDEFALIDRDAREWVVGNEQEPIEVGVVH